MPKTNKSTILDTIAKHAATRGVTVFLDGDNKSQAALLNKKFEFNAKDKHLTIVLDNLTPEEQQEILPIIREYLDKHGLVLDAEQEEVLENYQSYTEYNPYTDLLALYTGKIPTNDLNALKMSLYMKIQYEEGNNIDGIKQQIRDRFGSRGTYIANLCKAGYYEDAFKTQCLKLSPDKFTDYYELRVGKELAALFVHSGLTMTGMEMSFSEKISGCILNGVSKFRVLGIGRKNVELIKEFKTLYEEHDWGTDIEWVLKLESPLPHMGIEYDIILP